MEEPVRQTLVGNWFEIEVPLAMDSVAQVNMTWTLTAAHGPVRHVEGRSRFDGHFEGHEAGEICCERLIWN
jgi:hypothetical protein